MHSTRTDSGTLAPRALSGPDHQRASDADRDQAIDRLRADAAAGRLDVDELARRTDAALAAVTLADLRALMTDLPEPEPASTTRPRHGPRSSWRLDSAVGVYLAVSVMLVAIWALTGAGYFWPIWPILGWGLCAVPRGAGSTCRAPARARRASP